MKVHLAKLPELEKNNAALFKEKADLLEKIGKITLELNEVKESCVKVNKELATLTDKLGMAQKENATSSAENSKLASQVANLQAENSKAIQAVQVASELKNENLLLSAIIEELKATQTAPAVGRVRGGDKVLLDENVQKLQDHNLKLQTALEEWMQLAKVSTRRLFS
jgi:chromosome segregation ATPase